MSEIYSRKDDILYCNRTITLHGVTNRKTWNGRGVGKPLGCPKWNGGGVGEPLGSLSHTYTHTQQNMLYILLHWPPFCFHMLFGLLK